MRISGGTHRGRVLKVPPGRDVRPASDMIRQALFNILGERIQGASVLDLFAGTGSLGIEALSRGASRVVFVERDREVANYIRDNSSEIGMADHVRVLSFDILTATSRLRSAGGPFDFVFVAPPYPMMLAVTPTFGVGALVESLFTDAIVAPGAVVMLQHDRQMPLADEWPHALITDQRTYGKTMLTFFAPKEP